MARVYIIYSASLDSYYVGFTTESVSIRVSRHNEDYYENKYTGNGKPWQLFLEIACTSERQARLIEQHIKSMKSRKYFENLAKYEDMRNKLVLRFADS